MHGNVWEWVRDAYGSPSYLTTPAPGDGEHVERVTRNRVHRGGGFKTRASEARSAYRDARSPAMRHDALGVRPARALDS